MYLAGPTAVTLPGSMWALWHGGCTWLHGKTAPSWLIGTMVDGLFPGLHQANSDEHRTFLQICSDGWEHPDAACAYCARTGLSSETSNTCIVTGWVESCWSQEVQRTMTLRCWNILEVDNDTGTRAPVATSWLFNEETQLHATCRNRTTHDPSVGFHRKQDQQKTHLPDWPEAYNDPASGYIMWWYVILCDNVFCWAHHWFRPFRRPFMSRMLAQRERKTSSIRSWS